MSKLGKYRAYDLQKKAWVPESMMSLSANGELWIADEFQYTHLAPPDVIKVSFWTGLQDKNGKEIWEGDVYEWEGEIRLIIFDDGKFQGCTGFGQYVDLYLHAEDCKVLGNKFEHPNLLPSNSTDRGMR